jgi:hypothetical protein
MADVLTFPGPLSRVPREERIVRLRDAHDGFRAVGDVCELAAIHQHQLPPVFLNGLYVILSREGEVAERKLAAGTTITLNSEPLDEPA